MACIPDQRTEIINSEPLKVESSFPQFPRLPPEIRIKIWRQSLCYERLLRVDLQPGATAEDLTHEDEPWPACRAARERLEVQSDGFMIVLRTRDHMSKLFRVCYESRQLAISFYRVKVPCYFKQKGVPAQQVTLFLHPELDILRISGLSYFAKFAHKIWNLDHHHTGLVNVAFLSGYKPKHFDELFQELDDQDILRQALARLQSVIFGYDGNLGRAITKSFMFGGKGRLFRSRPLLASVSRFDRLPQDPRSIHKELKEVYLPLGDPREQIYRWFRLLDRWGIIDHERRVQYRFMITTDDRRVETREEARMSLQEENEIWQKCRKLCKNWLKPGKRTKRYREDRTLPSAYGFWLFPIDAFGMIPDAHPDIRHEGALTGSDLVKPANVWAVKKPLQDLSIQKPQLCLQHLPSIPQPNPGDESSERPSWPSFHSRPNSTGYGHVARFYLDL
ncbi:unnamed protein product [Clonostachys rosea]|uniref:2EXR domain-containing protein n=1 Tax=Bionectria ochroleuca TaxID=29856 RepID=A0ABY6U3N4_BIOOC|nr:unnamed protein product [Clonostachys rosea]